MTHSLKFSEWNRISPVLAEVSRRSRLSVYSQREDCTVQPCLISSSPLYCLCLFFEEQEFRWVAHFKASGKLWVRAEVWVSFIAHSKMWSLSQSEPEVQQVKGECVLLGYKSSWRSFNSQNNSISLSSCVFSMRGIELESLVGRLFRYHCLECNVFSFYRTVWGYIGKLRKILSHLSSAFSWKWYIFG